MLNNAGAITQPCLTPLVTGNGSEYSPSFWTHVCMPSWNCRTIAIYLGGKPNFAIIFQSPSRPTVSNALVKSTKFMHRSTCCSWHFSCSCLAVKIMSIVPLSFLNPHWLSGISPAWSRFAFRRFKNWDSSHLIGLRCHWWKLVSCCHGSALRHRVS